MILAALVHGALGILDEVLLYGLIVVILIIIVMLLLPIRKPYYEDPSPYNETEQPPVEGPRRS